MTITKTIGWTALAALLWLLSTFVVSAAQDWPPNPIHGINVAFKLDPRITRALYMGDRWVPAPFTQRGDEKQVIVEARAEAVDASGKRLNEAVEWIPADPTMATVASGQDNQVAITVLRPGLTSLRLVAGAISMELTLTAVHNTGALEAQLSPKE